MTGAQDGTRDGVTGGIRGRGWIAVAAGLALLVAVLGLALARGGAARPVLAGRAAPDFTLHRVDGRGTVRLSALRGRVVVVNFWASWCAPCRTEFPVLRRAWATARDRGAVFVGVAFQDTPGAAAAFARDTGADWPVVTDPHGRAATSFGVRGIPETFFVDRTGTIAAITPGALTPRTLAARLDPLLGGSS